MIEITNWEKEASRYQLEELCSGVFVYSTKKGEENGEPPHKICPNCYQKHHKSFLQIKDLDYHGRDYVCTNPECKTTYTNYKERASVSF